ncbi:RHS repeat-associated core domain-containing protein [Nocardia sp. IBHARD005]|uniref:RHS repeat-associated core domain-containing protein n=1 Tax=Nocardia sp. IBHARD005 TaxID=3457765 RepID=UPI0040590F9F
MTNPLIAAREVTTDWSTGISLVSSVTDLSDAISGGSWIEVGLGVVGLGAEAVSLVVDPLGTLAGYGVGWLIEHCQPLQDALDWIAGDPAQIEAYAKTWDNVATRISEVATAQNAAVTADVSDWTGQTATAYKSAASNTTNLLTAANTAATAAASAIRMAGGIVAAVRETVRDLVAQTVGRLAVWAAELVFSVGLATPLVAIQATAYIAKTVATISKLFSKLAKTMAKLKPLLKQLKSAFGDIAKAFKKTPSKSSKNADNTTTSPAATKNTDTSTTPSTTKQPDTPTNPATTTDTPSKTPDTPETKPATTLTDTTKPDTKLPDQADSGKPDLNKTAKQTTDCNDPVDAATGEFLLPETDVNLLGVLPLTLARRHRSSYRFGRWFGPSWAATVDMRVIVDQVGVKFVGPDGELWQFPHTAPDVAVASVHKGTRATMTRAETGGYRVYDPDRELTWAFYPNPGMGGLDTQLGNYAISEIIDRHGNRILFHFNDNGEPTHVVHSGGYRVNISVTEDRITALTVVGTLADGTDVSSLVREFGYTAGELTAVTNGVGATTTYQYDAQHRILGWRDSRGTEMRNTYDTMGRVVAQTGTEGILSATFAYEKLPQYGRTRTHYTNSRSGVTIFEFDEELCLRYTVNPRGATVRTEYNEYRQPVQYIDSYTNVVSYLYDKNGDLTRITRPDGLTITIDYQGPKCPATVTDVDGSTTYRTYDSRGNLVSVTDPDGVHTSYTHHPVGAPATIVESSGTTITVDVDGAGLPVRVTNADGAVTRIARDHFGRACAVTDALGLTTTYVYSTEGKQLSRIGPDGTTDSWQFDGEGNLLAYVNPVGGHTHYTYGAFDLCASRRDASGETTTYTYDTERNLIAVTNPLGDTWNYTYDETNNVVCSKDYSGAQTTTRYDLLNRPEIVTTPTEVELSHRYDRLGRLTSIRTSTDDWISRTYTPTGHIATARNGHGDDTTHAIALTHTPGGRLLSQQMDDQPPALYAYDAHGREVDYTTPNGNSTKKRYNTSGRIEELIASGHKFSFTFDASGRQNSWRTPVVGQHWAHKGTGHRTVHELVQLEPATGIPTQLIQRDEYTWRADGLLDAHMIARPGGAEYRKYELDSLGRVNYIIDSHAGVVEYYKYDALSNLIAAHISDDPASDSEPARHQYRHNILTSIGGVTYSHDAAGRLVRREHQKAVGESDVWNFEYDYNDQLTGVFTPNGEHWRYTYDAFGRRVTKENVTGSDRYRYTWDRTHLVEQSVQTREYAEITAWAYQPETYIPLAQSIFREGVESQFHVIVTGTDGAPKLLIDGHTGTAVSYASTTLWGALTWSGATCPHRLQGQYYDSETELHYNLHRYFDPKTGRYITSDPLGLAPANNSYTYPRNPTAWSDPLGLAPESCSQTSSRSSNDPLFRGTTRGYEGNPGLAETGWTPTSEDPRIATIFATGSEDYGEAVVQIARGDDLAGVERDMDYGYFPVEREVPVNISPGEFSSRASIEIPASAAREILADMGIDIPRRIDTGNMRDIMDETPAMTAEQIQEFIERAERI